MYGMQKTTVYLPDDLKRAIETKARSQGVSEAQVIREAIEAATAGYRNPPKPRMGYAHGQGDVLRRWDEYLKDFGQR